jgi:hypothetical protein
MEEMRQHHCDAMHHAGGYYSLCHIVVSHIPVPGIVCIESIMAQCDASRPSPFMELVMIE